MKKQATVPTRVIAAFLTAILFVGFFIPLTQTLAASAYEAVIISKTGGGTLSMAPGERKTVTVEFQNAGTNTWKNDGSAYISVYTHGPKYRTSVFDPGTWEWSDHPARIQQTSVAPGSKASVSFDLHAPATEGVYEETFHLAAEETAWVTGGEFSFTIHVEEQAEEPVAFTDSGTYKAELLVQSAHKVSAKAGRSVLLSAAFKNTGTKTWTNYGLVKPDVSVASASSSFTHPSWNGEQLAYANARVAPGETAIVSFAITAPSTNGVHTARFQLQANGESVDDAFIELPVEVTGGAGEAVASPVEEAPATDENLIDEPVMRIAFLIVDEETDNEVVITSAYSDFTVKDTQGTVLAEMAQNETVTAYYANGVYYFDAGEGLKKSSYPIRFEPADDHAVMRVANFDRRITRGHKYADNEFRGALELRYNDYKDRTWLINELSVEYYLRGLAETSNISHIEFQKTLITAARTYAYYHFTRGTKYAKEGFHMSSYSWDQVYNGYGQEKRAPKITQAVEATRGTVVTYDGDLAITPYFSRSDGRTRDWSEVWNGSVPWAKSVSVPCDAGKTLWGHGVGLSASGALCMANNGELYEDILKHFYTGIDLTRTWN